MFKKILVCGLLILCLGAANVVATGQTEEPEPEGPMTLTWLGFNERGHIMEEGTPVELYLEELFDIDLKPVPVDWYDNEQINLYLAANDPPDYIGSKRPGSYIESGVLRTVTREMLSTYAPTIIGSLEEADPLGQGWAAVTSGGEIYGLPQHNWTGETMTTMVTRSDWLEAVGETENTGDLQWFEDLFLKYRNNDPDGNGQRDTYAYGAYDGGGLRRSTFAYVFAHFGVYPAGWMEASDGTLVESSQTEGYREALNLLARWYELEIIDPDFVTDGRAEVREKYVAGRLGAYEQGPRWVQNQVDTPVGLLLDQNPDAQPVYLRAPIAPDGNRYTTGYSLVAGTANMFGADTSDEKVIRILEMQEAIFSDLDLYRIVNNGFEGVHWDFDEAGNVLPRPEWFTREKQVEVGMSKYKLHGTQTRETVQVRLTAAYRIPFQFPIDNMVGVRPVINPTSTEVYRQYLADANAVRDEFYFQAITGQIDVDEDWNDYLQRWEQAGGGALTEEVNRQYQALLDGQN